MPCINCNIEFEGDFCPTCWEKKNVDRITLQSIFSGLLDMDKGLLFNLKKQFYNILMERDVKFLILSVVL